MLNTQHFSPPESPLFPSPSPLPLPHPSSSLPPPPPPVSTAIIPATSVCNFDGQLDSGEECDDGNNRDNDGCTSCIMDPIQVEFNSSTPVGTDYSIEFFDLDQPVFFADPSLLRVSLAPSIPVRPV